MKKELLTILTLLSLISSLSYADFEKGMSAYKERDYYLAFEYFKPLAESGESESQLYLGSIYNKARGDLKNDKESFKWFYKSAEQGNSEAQYVVARLLGKGKGTKKNLKSSIEWYKKSAEQGHARSQWNLGIKYARGSSGLLKNLHKAKYWIEKSHTNGDDKIKQMSERVWNEYELWKY